MMQGYDPAIFWNEQCKKHGHTGWSDKLAYKYDQPLRLRAIDKALSRLKIDGNIHALDIGCGSGDIVALLQKRGFNVTGIDIGKEVIKLAKERFSGDANVELLCGRIENMDFSKNSFDLVTSVTVLQHITNEESVLTAVKKIVDAVKGGGHLLIFESAPYKAAPKPRSNADFMVVRERGKWIDMFEKEGCALVYESSYPDWSTEFLLRFNRVSRGLLYLILSHVKSRNSKEKLDTLKKDSERSRMEKVLYSAFKLILTVIFAISYPVDHIFHISFPKKYANIRILVFKKEMKR